MSYAIFYSHEDLTSIAANVQATISNSYDAFLTVQERNSVKQAFQKAWTNGLSGWATAPPAGALAPDYDPNFPQNTADSLIVMVNGNGGSSPTKDALISAMRVIGGKVPNAQYMIAIADDLVGTCVEPWV